MFMELNEAVSKRISELCKERGLTQYALYKLTGVPQSTISTIINCRFPGMKLRIIYEICDGLGITIKEFFDSPIFDRENITD